ncbi:MAG: glycosyltransferase, partial [Abitibacteriaceae bacterium]|nr:glycosyltransferase [Abditibacteriaceae bacterium]
MANIKLLSIIEATTVTGPAKVLLEFYQSARHTSDATPGAPQVDASIITFNRGRPNAAAIDAKAPNHFVAVARDAGLHVDVVPERFRFDTRVIANLRQIVESFQPDIIESHHVKSHFLVRMSGLWRQRPWVAYHHGYTMTDLKMHAYNQLDRWSLQAANRIITVSRASARGLESMGVPSTRIRALHNAISPGWNEGISQEDVQALKNRLEIKEGERIILSVGRLSKEKAQVDLVTALGHLKQRYSDLNVKLVLVGDG